MSMRAYIILGELHLVMLEDGDFKVDPVSSLVSVYVVLICRHKCFLQQFRVNWWLRINT